MDGGDDLYPDLLAMLESGRLSDAQVVLSRLLEVEGSSQRLVVAQAGLLEAKGKPEEAALTLERCLQQSSNSAAARANLARLQWKAGDRHKAVANLRLALIQDPNQERALHFYAALLQEDGGFAAAATGLRLLSQAPAVWLPAWVGAQLASHHGSSAETAALLRLSAQRSGRGIWPPNLQRLEELVRGVPWEQQRELATELRPYCTSDAQAVLDRLLALPVPVRPIDDKEQREQTRVTLLRRSVWRHLARPDTVSQLGIAPVQTIRPEGWGVADVAHRLGRGFALLLAEALDAQADTPAAVILESHPGAGMIVRETPPSGETLSALAGSSCRNLTCSYLSFQPPDEFILDAEIYTSAGVYIGRESCRANHPGLCVGQMAQKLSTRVGSSSVSERSSGAPPQPQFDIPDALAREAAASFVLCADGALHSNTLGNPGLALDNLAGYAIAGETGAALLTLWAAVEAAARARIPGAEDQQAMMAEILTANSWLAQWTQEAGC